MPALFYRIGLERSSERSWAERQRVGDVLDLTYASGDVISRSFENMGSLKDVT